MEDLTSLLSLFDGKNLSEDKMTSLLTTGMNFVQPLIETEIKRSKYRELSYIFEDDEIDFTEDPWMSLKWEYKKIMKHVDDVKDKLEDLPMLEESDWYKELEEENELLNTQSMLTDYEEASKYITNTLLLHKHLDYTKDSWVELITIHSNLNQLIESLNNDITTTCDIRINCYSLKRKFDALWIDETILYLKEHKLL